MYLSTLKIWNFRQFGETRAEGTAELTGTPGLHLEFNPRLNVLIGQNDSGKTAIIDAIKFTLGTKSLDTFWLEDRDFHDGPIGRASSIKIECLFKGFNSKEAGSFIEWLGTDEDGFVLKVWLIANRRDQTIQTRIKAGSDDEGVILDPDAKDNLKAIYLKPLRDALAELTPGYRSRLAQILKGHNVFKDKKDDQGSRVEHKLEEKVRRANAEISSYFKIQETDDDPENEGQIITREIKQYLDAFSFYDVENSPEFFMSKAELNEILKKLSLILESNKSGLGSLNKLYMATEFLLLNQSHDRALKLALIEEIEAHLHPQAQLQIIDSLQNDKPYNGQLIITSHSTTLASKIKLDSLILCQNKDAYSMAPGKTKLSPGDYSFLERFLDDTKANIFFAKGVIFVEGDSENLLIPKIAEIIDRPLHKYGVSLVNVRSTAFLRYANILERTDGKTINIKASIVTDLDVPSIEYYNDSENKKTVHFIDATNIDEFREISTDVDFDSMIGTYNSLNQFDLALSTYKTINRFPNGVKKNLIEKFKETNREISDEDINASREKTLELKRTKFTSGNISGYVATKWTLEYELALSDLKEILYKSCLEAKLMQSDDSLILPEDENIEISTQVAEFFDSCDGDSVEVIAYKIFKPINDGEISKAIIAQRLALNLNKEEHQNLILESEQLKYLREAIYNVTKPIEDGDQE
jgi:putative ATP-dependent endonuclease of OLD family